MNRTPPSAEELLRGLVGSTITTITGQANRILAIDGSHVAVGTMRSPDGQPVPIADVQAAIDELFARGSLAINPESVGYRSAFVGAVLSMIPGVKASTQPAMVQLEASPGSEPRWTLEPGGTIRRLAIHEEFGGNHDRGISFSAQTPNIFIFSNPDKGSAHGYLDHWKDDVLHYYGEGRLGDQGLTMGNNAIATHHESGRALRVFQGTGGVVTFLGTFEVDADQPFYWTDGVDMEGALRKLVVFRLVPIGSEWLKGDLPTIDPSPLGHGELQAWLAELSESAGCGANSTDPDSLCIPRERCSRWAG